MRTTIEMKEEHRAQLLDLSARRGEKGFSQLVSEAIEAYLATVAQDAGKRRRALLLRGSISPKEADSMQKEAAALRGSWR